MGTACEVKHLAKPILMQLLIDGDQLESSTAVELANLLQLEKLLERGNTQIILNLTHDVQFSGLSNLISSLSGVNKSIVQLIGAQPCCLTRSLSFPVL